MKVEREEFSINARELWNELGKPQGKFSDWIKRKVYRYLKKDMEYKMYIDRKISSQGGRPRQEALLTIEGAKKLCKINTTDGFKAKKKLKQLNVMNVDNFLSFRKEIIFLDKLEEVLEPFHIQGIRQYNVLTYRIDYYIPELKIAIEYDENEHRHYTYEKHELRQKQIEDNLGCKFIRINDDKSDAYNIGIVLKEIIRKEAA